MMRCNQKIVHTIAPSLIQLPRRGNMRSARTVRDQADAAGRAPRRSSRCLMRQLRSRDAVRLVAWPNLAACVGLTK
jgi:hypothetical protein